MRGLQAARRLRGVDRQATNGRLHSVIEGAASSTRSHNTSGLTRLLNYAPRREESVQREH